MHAGPRAAHTSRRHNARIPLDLASGSYFGSRTPEDGRIDWSQTPRAPQLFARCATVSGVHHDRRRPARLLRTRVLDAAGPSQPPRIRSRKDAASRGGGGTLVVREIGSAE
jgi:hypothetical protein